jgi:hypothetical protein
MEYMLPFSSESFIPRLISKRLKIKMYKTIILCEQSYLQEYEYDTVMVKVNGYTEGTCRLHRQG